MDRYGTDKDRMKVVLMGTSSTDINIADQTIL